MASPESQFERARSVLEDGGWSKLLQSGFGTIFLAWVFATADLFGTFFSRVFSPFQALFGGIATLITGIIGSGLNVIGAGEAASVESFQSGIGAYAGPFAWVLAIIVVLVGLAVLEWWWNRSNLDPWGLLLGWRR